MLTTASPTAVERTSGLLRDVMDKDYARVIKMKLDNVYKGGTTGPGARGEKAEKENRQSFIVGSLTIAISTFDDVPQILLNDLDISSSHMERLIKDMLQSNLIPQYFLDTTVEEVRNSLNSFMTLVPKYRSTLRVCASSLSHQTGVLMRC